MQTKQTLNTNALNTQEVKELKIAKATWTGLKIVSKETFTAKELLVNALQNIFANESEGDNAFEVGSTYSTPVFYSNGVSKEEARRIIRKFTFTLVKIPRPFVNRPRWISK